MLYREAGDFKTSYRDDSQTFPLKLDRIGYYVILAVAFLVIPFVITDYWANSVLVPFLIFAIGISHGVQKINGIALQSSEADNALTAARRTFRQLFLPGMIAILADAVELGMATDTEQREQLLATRDQLRERLDRVSAMNVLYYQGGRWLAWPSDQPAHPGRGVRLELQRDGAPYVCTFALPWGRS